MRPLASLAPPFTAADSVYVAVRRVKNCTKIIVMEGGKKVEEGSHKELMSIDVRKEEGKGGKVLAGHYHNMWDTQMGEETFADASLMSEELLQGKMFAAVFGYGETRQDLPLSTPAFSQLAKELVDRVIERPDSEPFHKPVRPIEDGCAGVGACVSLCQVSSSWRFQNVCPPPDLHHSHLGIALLVKCVCVLCRWSGFVRVIVRRGGVAGRSKCRVLCRLR